MPGAPSELNLELVSRVHRAGAGAGKTTRLVNDVYALYRSFLSRHGRPPRIVITTFTKKATQELKERLSVLAIENNDFEMLRRLGTGQTVLISTIHGILSVFLRRQSQSLGMDAEFRIEDTAESQRRLKRAIRGVLRAQPEFLELIEIFEFNAIVNMIQSAYPVLLSHEGVHMASGSDQHRLLLDHLHRLKSEALTVSDQILSETADAKWVEAAGLLKATASTLQEIKTAALDDVRRTLEKAATLWALFRKPQHRADRPKVSDHANELFSQWLQEFKDLDIDMFDPAAWKESTRLGDLFLPLAQTVTAALQKDKVENGVLSTDDLEVLTLQLIRQQPQAAHQFQEQWDYWFIDEYQDTSPLQVTLLKQLMGATPHYVVGDPQQSIYFFRGARTDVFQEKIQDITQRGGVIESLQNNYRSQPALLEYFNWFFQNVRKQTRADFTTMIAKAKPADAELSSSPTPVQILAADDEPHERAAIVARVLELLNSGAALGDIAILARRRADLHDLALLLDEIGVPCHVQSSGGFYDRREILDTLQLLKFFVTPFDTRNLIGILRSPWCVVDDGLLAYFRSASTGPLWPRLLAWAQTPSEDRSIEALGISPSTLAAAREILLKLQSYVTAQQQDGVSAVFRRALVDLGFFSFCHVHDATGQRESNLWKIVQKLKEVEHQPNFNFHRFIREVELGLSNPVEQNDSDAIAALEPSRVTLMTVHASKGLQFLHVIVPFLNRKPNTARSEFLTFDETTRTFSLASPGKESGWIYLPTARAVTEWRKKQEAAEGVRLLYVAMTRARLSLTMSYSGDPAHGSWGETLQAGSSSPLDQLSTGAYPYNDANGTTHGHFLVRNESWDTPVWAPKTADTNIVRPFYQARTNGTATSTTATAAASRRPEHHLASKQALAIARAGQKGIRVHRLLENLFHEARRRGAAVLSGPARGEWLKTQGEGDTAFLPAMDFILSCADVPMKDLLTSGHSEWPFTFLKDDFEIKGQIDLWGMVDNVVWIVDYKTGSSDSIETAFRQMSIYAEALRIYGHTQPIRLVAMYPMDKMCTVRDSQM